MGSETYHGVATRVRLIIQRISYKPWLRAAFEVDYDLSRKLFRIILRCHCPDSTVSRDKAPSIRLESERAFPEAVLAAYSDQEIIETLFGLIEEFELHEAQEWFRVDGVVVYDPHALLPKTRL